MSTLSDAASAAPALHHGIASFAMLRTMSRCQTVVVTGGSVLSA